MTYSSQKMREAITYGKSDSVYPYEEFGVEGK